MMSDRTPTLAQAIESIRELNGRRVLSSYGFIAGLHRAIFGDEPPRETTVSDDVNAVSDGLVDLLSERTGDGGATLKALDALSADVRDLALSVGIVPTGQETAHELVELVARWCDGAVGLPRDADGVPVRPGDIVKATPDAAPHRIDSLLFTGIDTWRAHSGGTTIFCFTQATHASDTPDALADELCELVDDKGSYSDEDYDEMVRDIADRMRDLGDER